MTNREFVRLARQAYSELPIQVIQRLENVDVVVEEWPGPDDEDLVGNDGTLFGLYTGVPSVSYTHLTLPTLYSV